MVSQELVNRLGRLVRRSLSEDVPYSVGDIMRSAVHPNAENSPDFATMRRVFEDSGSRMHLAFLDAVEGSVRAAPEPLQGPRPKPRRLERKPLDGSMASLRARAQRKLDELTDKQDGPTDDS